jgi:hypothetical protein
MDALRLKLNGAWLQDWEPDRYSPFLTGAPSADRGADHSVAWVSRFHGLNVTLDGVWSPDAPEWLVVTGLLAASSNYVNPDYATNLVKQGQGFSPVLFVVDENGNPVSAQGLAGVVRAELSDPLDIGLSLKAEYFNIGSEYNAVMGARREADVLLTDGIITTGLRARRPAADAEHRQRVRRLGRALVRERHRLARLAPGCSSTCAAHSRRWPSTPSSGTTPTCRTGIPRISTRTSCIPMASLTHIHSPPIRTTPTSTIAARTRAASTRSGRSGRRTSRW